jgi:O-antigen ligase
MIADNMYLTLIAETGMLGFLSFLIFSFSFLKKGWEQLKILNSNSNGRWELLVSLMAFIGLLVNMGGYELFYWPNQYLLFCIVTGACKKGAAIPGT